MRPPFRRIPLPLAGPAAPLPENQFYWPPPKTGYNYQDSYREWSLSTSIILRGLNTNRIFAKTETALPPATTAVTWYREWSINLQQTTLARPQLPRNQSDWPLPQAHAARRQVVGWEFNPTPLRTIVVVQRPFNQFDWPLPAPQPRVGYTWLRSTFGQQAVFAPRATSVAPRETPTWYRDWNQNLVLTTLAITVQQFPFYRQQSTTLPIRGAEPDRGFATSYNINLIPKEAPIGEITAELAPAQKPPEQVQLRSWQFNYNLNLVGKDRLPTGVEIYDLAPTKLQAPDQIQLRQWTWSYNRSLVGQDKLPNRQLDWPLPIAPPRLDQTIATSYTKSLIGQDSLPVSKQYTDLTQRDFARVVQTWVQTVNLALTTGVVPRPFNQFDWPLPQRTTRAVIDYAARFNLSRIGSDLLPAVQKHWPLTPAQRGDATLYNITASYTLALRGKDRLPFTQQDWQRNWPLNRQAPRLPTYTWADFATELRPAQIVLKPFTGDTALSPWMFASAYVTSGDMWSATFRSPFLRPAPIPPEPPTPRPPRPPIDRSLEADYGLRKSMRKGRYVIGRR